MGALPLTSAAAWPRVAATKDKWSAGLSLKGEPSKRCILQFLLLIYERRQGIGRALLLYSSEHNNEQIFLMGMHSLVTTKQGPASEHRHGKGKR